MICYNITIILVYRYLGIKTIMRKKTDFLFVFMVILIGNILTLNNAFSEENHHSSHAHVHGEADVTIALIGSSLEIELISPAHNLVGFEYEARTPAEIAEVKQTESVLVDPSRMFQLKGAECNFSNMSINSGSLLKNEDNHHDHGHSHHHSESEENKVDKHSNFKVKYNISCGSDSFPKSIKFLLFKHFKNLDSINVKWISENSQGAKRLTASDSTVGF